MSEAAELARRLRHARQTGTLIDPPDAPLDEAAAHGVLAAILALGDEPITAWKVGATAEGAPAKLGLSAPFIGPLFASSVVVCDGEGKVTLPEVHGLQAEVEVVFRFGEDLPADAPSEIVLAAVDGVAVGIEFPGSRWTRPLDPPGPGFIADHAGGSALLVGAFTADWRGLDLAAAEARLMSDGGVIGASPGARVMGDPVNALLHFARQVPARGGAITRGLMLTSGGIVGPIDIAAPSRITGTIDGLIPLVADVRSTP